MATPPSPASGNPLMRALHSFSPTAVRPFARRNFRYELLASATWPVAVSMVEGAVTGVIAKKAFADTPDWIIATLTAAPAFCNVTSFLWTRLAEGHMAVRALISTQITIALLILSIAFIPLNTFGLYWFLCAVVIARFCFVGVITLRSVMWRANYARFERAKITGRLITINTMIVAITSILLGRAMDWNEQVFRIVYPSAVVMGLVGVWAYSRVRIRRPFLIKSVTRADLVPTDYGQPPFAHDARRMRRYGHYLNSAVGYPARAASRMGATLADMIRVLREDMPFRGYMTCMMLTGIGNLAIMPQMILLLTEEFQLGYTLSLAVLQSFPLVMMPFAIPLWARFLDNVHVIRFRAVHVWVFVIAHACTFGGAVLHSLPLIIVGQFVRGIGFGGGALAWNIGHNDFSSRSDAGLYMSIHVTLTGLRGFVGGYLGVLMYSGFAWGAWQVPALKEYSFAFWAIITLLGALGFVYLNWKLGSVTRDRPGD